MDQTDDENNKIYSVQFNHQQKPNKKCDLFLPPGIKMARLLPS
jgi:hypothetical protein